MRAIQAGRLERGETAEAVADDYADAGSRYRDAALPLVNRAIDLADQIGDEAVKQTHLDLRVTLTPPGTWN